MAVRPDRGSLLPPASGKLS